LISVKNNNNALTDKNQEVASKEKNIGETIKNGVIGFLKGTKEVAVGIVDIVNGAEDLGATVLPSHSSMPNRRPC